MIQFIGARNDTSCTVGYYDTSDPTDAAVTLGAGGAVDINNFTLTLPSAYSNGDTVLLVPVESSTLPTGWLEGTLYTLDETTTDVYLLLDRQGNAIEPETTGTGRMQVIAITELVNSRSIAKANEYEWGYVGFNPQQLAYDLIVQTDVLWDTTITVPNARTYAIAQNNYEQFAAEMIAKLPHDRWTLDYTSIVAWLERNITVTADFAVSSVAGNVTTTVFTFYPLVTGYNLEYIWGFGDGTGSTDKQPTHSYSTDDKRYTITLSVRNSMQFDTRFREEYITIGDPPLVVLA